MIQLTVPLKCHIALSTNEVGSTSRCRLRRQHEESISKNEWQEILWAVSPYDDQLADQILERLNEE